MVESESHLSAPAMEAQKGAMFAWMQEVAPYGIFTTDGDLRIRTWNQWLVNQSGFSSGAVVGRLLVEVFPDVRARRLDEYLRRALHGETSLLSTALHKYLLPLPVSVRGFEGPHMLQTVRIAPLPLGGHVVGTITTIEDVTQRECQAIILQRQQEHDRLHSAALALLLQSNDPLSVTAELFPRIAGPLKLEAYLNYLLSPDQTELRLQASGGVTPDVRRMMAVLPVGNSPCGQSALERRPVVLERVQSSTAPQHQAVRRIGLRSYAAFPLLIGDRLLGTLSFGSYSRDAIAADEVEFLATIAQYLAIAIDRSWRESALLQARQSLSEHAESLETKVAERTARLHETIAQLESFTYTVAHDLRAPIRSLKSYSEILLTEHAGAISAEGTAMLHRIQRAGNRLDALTRDLLRFSKIAREDVQLGPLDVAEVVHDIVTVTPQLRPDVLQVEPPLGRVIAQRTLLQQCLSNLFDNALKFASPRIEPRIVVRSELRREPPPVPPGADDPGAAFHPPITCTLNEGAGATRETEPAVAPDRAPRVRIWIEDNGIGIPGPAQKKIFGIFERGSGVEHIEGTGIGLAIVARAMQQMGGSCGVESTAGKGSRFWLELAAAE